MDFQLRSGKKLGAVLLFIGIAQFYIFLNIAAFVDKGYNISNNSISHLGIISTGYIFNVSIIFLGIFEILAALNFKVYSRMFMIFIILAGIGSIGVGIFNKNYGVIHLIFALFAFLFPSIATYVTLSKDRTIMSALWALMGTVAIVSLILFLLTIEVSHSFDLGLGEGGMERMVLIPNIIWALTFAGSKYYESQTEINDKIKKPQTTMNK